MRSLERKGYFCQDFFFGGGCVVWRGRGIFARIFFFLGGGGCVVWRGRGIFARIFFFFGGGGCVVWRGRGIFARGFLLPLNQYITNMIWDEHWVERPGVDAGGTGGGGAGGGGGGRRERQGW